MKYNRLINMVCVVMLTLLLSMGCGRRSGQTVSENKDNNVITMGEVVRVSGVGATVDKGTVKITQSGEYEIMGNSEEGSIIVETDGEVILNLNGVNINNSSDSVIKVINAEKVYINIVDGTKNTLTDGAEYSGDGKGVIFSNDELVLGGNGVLNITANYKHGIVSDDELTLNSSTLNITAVTDGLHANGQINIKDGVLNITAESDGIESENIVIVDGGTINADVQGDGIKSAEDMIINGGTINVLNADEGIESKKSATINGGDISCNVSDDGINAGGELTINNGNIYLFSEKGDALDSNSGITIAGGMVVAVGGDNPEGGIDCDNKPLTITGGTLFAAGGTNSMPSNETSTQCSVSLSGVGADELIAVNGDNGIVFVFKSPKSINSVIFSSVELVSERSYTVFSGGEVTGGTEFGGLYIGSEYTAGTEVTTFTQESMFTEVGGNAGMRGGMNGGRRSREMSENGKIINEVSGGKEVSKETNKEAATTGNTDTAVGMPQISDGELYGSEITKNSDGAMHIGEPPQMPDGKWKEDGMPQMPEGGEFKGESPLENISAENTNV